MNFVATLVIEILPKSVLTFYIGFVDTDLAVTNKGAANTALPCGSTNKEIGINKISLP